MAKGYIGSNTYKCFLGNVKMKKGYIGGTRVYSAGEIVTYIIDTGITKQEEVDEGSSTLSPKTFTPSKTGWTFIGWRSDKTANGSVLTSKIMGDSPITLYAVFRQTITVSYAGNGHTGGSTASQTGYRYYNNGNVANPSFTLSANGFTKTNYIFTGWKSGSTDYSAGQSITLSSNLALSAQWYSSAITPITPPSPAGYGITSWTVPITGLYLITCKGAGGSGGRRNIGDFEGWFGGNGGLTKYYASLTAGTTLYIVIGGRGLFNEGGNGTSNPDLGPGTVTNIGKAGGFNGGGDAGSAGSAAGLPGSGGGATHVSLRNALLKNTPTNDLLCVAGGGGGAGDWSSGGNGGGLTGETAETGVFSGGTGGTQTGPGQNNDTYGHVDASYGQGGGNAVGPYAGGGGGGLYGGNSGSQSSGGGGGSGYIKSTTTIYKGKTYTNTTTQDGGARGGYESGRYSTRGHVEAENGAASIQLIAT